MFKRSPPTPKSRDNISTPGAKGFLKLDTNNGFCQIPLDSDSWLLTTFLTPFGRYCFNKLPLGISSVLEHYLRHFQRHMSNILTGLPGVVCHVDDILIFGKGQAEHDTRLTAVFQAVQAGELTLNCERCQSNHSCIILTKPSWNLMILRELLSSQKSWVWGQAQQAAFEKL